jgi:hypothetical protein
MYISAALIVILFPQSVTIICKNIACEYREITQRLLFHFKIHILWCVPTGSGVSSIINNNFSGGDGFRKIARF